MKPNNFKKAKLPFFVVLSFTFVLVSCGSYQYVGSENDGIYSQREVASGEPSTTSETEASTNNDNTYYKNYFTEKVNQYSDIPSDERVIFTDIDSYEGDYSDENLEEGELNGYAGWGQANQNVSINYIDNGWGWNAGFGYGGWNNWGWNNWGWNAGFGWGGGFGWNAGWGYYGGWCPPYYGYNGNSYWNGGGYAYNYGRRGSNSAYGNRNSVSSRNSSNISRRNSSNVTRRNSTVSARNNSARSTTRRNTSARTSRSSATRPRTNTRSNSSISRPRSNSTRSNTRMSSPRRSSSSSARSSRGSSRSSGASRSSSSRGGSSRRR